MKRPRTISPRLWNEDGHPLAAWLHLLQEASVKQRVTAVPQQLAWLCVATPISLRMQGQFVACTSKAWRLCLVPLWPCWSKWTGTQAAHSSATCMFATASRRSAVARCVCSGGLTNDARKQRATVDNVLMIEAVAEHGHEQQDLQITVCFCSVSC